MLREDLSPFAKRIAASTVDCVPQVPMRAYHKSCFPCEACALCVARSLVSHIQAKSQLEKRRPFGTPFSSLAPSMTTDVSIVAL